MTIIFIISILIGVIAQIAGVLIAFLICDRNLQRAVLTLITQVQFRHSVIVLPLVAARRKAIIFAVDVHSNFLIFDTTRAYTFVIEVNDRLAAISTGFRIAITIVFVCHSTNSQSAYHLACNHQANQNFLNILLHIKFSPC